MPFLTLFWGRVPCYNKTTEKKGTLILASLLEDLVEQTDLNPVLNFFKQLPYRSLPRIPQGWTLEPPVAGLR